ncbi:MAG: SRPBCC domain-containing protein [Planctomycetes bacterium]|nr:SRPBCC domain-containing protein [Planctomycetota bacterium]
MHSAILALLVCLLTTSFAPREVRVTAWEGDVDAPVAAVWRAYTTAEGLRARGFVDAEVDLRVGGTLRRTLKSDGDGEPEKLVETILTFEPERLLATRSAASDATAWRATYFSELSPTRTHLRIAVVDPSEEPSGDDAELFALLCEAERAALAGALTLKTEPAPARKAKAPRTAVCERVVDASPAEVWKLYTTNAGAESWMVARASIEVAVGGVVKTSYDPQSNLADEGTIVTHVLAFEPERLWATRFEVPKAAAALALAEATWVVLTFEPVDGGKTRVRCSHQGFGEGAEWDPVFAFFEEGNASELDALAKRCDELRGKQ